MALGCPFPRLASGWANQGGWSDSEPGVDPGHGLLGWLGGISLAMAVIVPVMSERWTQYQQARF